MASIDEKQQTQKLQSDNSAPKFRVIGAGLPRTGTSSLRAALEILDQGPTMHMWTCWESAPLSKRWMEACERLSMGENVDEQLRALVEGYGSGVDTPVSDVYIELARVFPEAKVVLTHRPADEWHTSYVNMAKHLGGLYALWVYWNPECYWQRQMSMRGILPIWLAKYGSFGAHMMPERIQEAKDNIAPERLLLFDVKEGWEPLCKFLDVPVPGVPFPRVNDAAQVGQYIDAKVQLGKKKWLRIAAGTGTVIALSAAVVWVL